MARYGQVEICRSAKKVADPRNTFTKTLKDHGIACISTGSQENCRKNPRRSDAEIPYMLVVGPRKPKAGTAAFAIASKGDKGRDPSPIRRSLRAESDSRVMPEAEGF